MNKIESLTKEQEELCPKYVEKWVNVGTSTERISYEKVTEIIKPFYKNILEYGDSPQIYLVDNPSQAYDLTVILTVMDNNKEDITNHDPKELLEKRGHIITTMKKNKTYQFHRPYIYGSFDVGQIAFYDYINEGLGLELHENFKIYKEISNLGFVYCFPKYCVVSQKPNFISMKDGNLHNENGPALTYAGEPNVEVYSLNGVTVSKEIVMTPWNELDVNLVKTESNAEVRRELIRKIGIERVCEKLNAEVIDKVGDYELLVLDFNEVRRPYLKMKNPSIGVYHIEGVSPECKTVYEALNFRKPDELKKIPIDENGDDWFQQGDVAIWKKDSKSIKPNPTILT
jgi:hypothetical protein